MKTKTKPIVSWSIWAVGLLVIMLGVTRQQFIAGFTTDKTGMSYIIVILFMVGFIASLKAALKLHAEWDILVKVQDTEDLPAKDGKGGLSDLFNKLADYKSKGEVVSIDKVFDAYYAGHNSQVRLVSIISSLLITMGLLGTIIGLIMAISGLSAIVGNVGLSRDAMMTGLEKTVAGMGTAFYTTFFGAMLGGLVLRAVAVSQLNSLSELCASATEHADAKLTPKIENKEDELTAHLSRIITSFTRMQTEIDALTQKIADDIKQTMSQFGVALEAAGNKANTATETCFNRMTEQVEAMSTNLGSSLQNFNEVVDKASGDVAATAAAKLDKEATEIADQLNLAAATIQNFLKLKADGGNPPTVSSVLNNSNPGDGE